MNQDPLIGTTVDGRYLISRLIGGGGMGAVYEAHHAGTGRRVAVKVISTGDVAKNEALVGRFQREAKAAGSVDTQHIAQVLDTGRDPVTGLPFMVMEYLTGEDLQQFLRRVGPIAPDLALRIVAQACIGLQKAHEAHVVHRDIKPANLFLAHRDEGAVLVKVLDFGIAKVKMDQANATEADGLTRTGSMLGSPLYMSPEQARGHKTIDHRADLWSLGVVLYQALAGRTPYEHIDALGELIISICSEAPRLIQECAPWVPPEVAAIVHGALRLDPNDRFQTAGAMFEACKPLLAGGYALSVEQLVGMPAELRTYVAPRLSVPPKGATMPPPAPTATGRYAATGTVDAGTNDGVARSQQFPTARPASKLPLALGAVAILGVAAFGALKLLNPPADAVAETATTQIVATPPAAPVEPAPPTVTPAAVANDKTVKLVILPGEAQVEIDGLAVTNSDGIVEIVGTPGSVHKVRVFLGAAEIKREVVVTEAGALPPKIELEVPKSAKPAGPARVTTTSPAPEQPAAPKPPKSGLDRSFD